MIAANEISKNVFLLRNLSKHVSLRCLRASIILLLIVIWNMGYLFGVIVAIKKCVVYQEPEELLVAMGYREGCREHFSKLENLTFSRLFIYRCIEYLSKLVY